MKNNSKLKCIYCKEEIKFVTLIENCIICWPNQKWILFNCPNCNNNSYLELNDNFISIGIIDGALVHVLLKMKKLNYKAFHIK